MKKPAYVIISPVRNEEQYIEKTLLSVARQTVKPKIWLIVDDGSTDRTTEIIETYSKRYDFIECVKRPQNVEETVALDRIAKATPPRTFNYGLEHLSGIGLDYDYIVKLDGDLSFRSDYFERILMEFDEDPRLGIASGLSSFPQGSGFWTPYVPGEHVLGCSKIYRRLCFEDIGGLVEVLGWDTIDEIKAQMSGWRTKNFKDIALIHWRLMGSRTGFVRGKMRHGFTNYYLGYHPLYMLARIVKRTTDRPYLVSGVFLAAGYIKGWLTHTKQFPDKRFRSFLRETQLRQIKKILQRQN